ncbi:MAG: peptidoglycan DD-metalloendopeptidase family protein, partial [Pseudomonadales bacterium]
EKINTHWVSEGETLYAIAWRYNLDANRLAAANGLNSNARIYRGQVLRLDVHSALAQRRQVSARESQAASKSATSAAHKPAPHNNGQEKTARPANADRMVAGSWRWPAPGSVLERFNFRRGNGHKGLDISGRTGQSVHAAHNGVVVYAGSGLPAYGNLLIVKHSDEYLSAYAHNSRLTVREGDRVIAGQKIAELGRTGTTHAHLHFEIRKRGVPIDPLALLPRRSSGLG